MTAVLKLTGGTSGDLDLSSYLNAVEGDGLDPAPGGFMDPQFTDSAIGDGQALVNVSVQNSESVWPLHLRAASKDALHALVRTLRLKLDEPGVRVLWQDDGATLATYRDLQFGRWEPGYRYHRARHFILSGTLRCWASSYGHTATDRIVGTSAGSGFLNVISLGAIAGDAGAVVTCDIAGASRIRDFYGISVIPSGVVSEWPAASIAQAAATSALTGASGAVGSQYRGVHIDTSITWAGSIDVPMAGRIGRQRVLAIARTANLAGVNAAAYPGLPIGGPIDFLGPRAFLAATQIANSTEKVAAAWRGWQLLDLGVLAMPAAAMRVATQTIHFDVALASSASPMLLASPAFHLNAIYVLPEDSTTIIKDRSDNFGARLTPGRARFDGVLGESYDPVALLPFTSYQRGDFPTVNPGSGEQVAAFALGVVGNDPQAVTVRARERFTFQR